MVGATTTSSASSPGGWPSSAVDAATTARAHERWLAPAAEEEGTFAGVLVDLAERGAPVVSTPSGGRRHRGVVRAVADDFVALRTGPGTECSSPIAASRLVRPGSGSRR